MWIASRHTLVLRGLVMLAFGLLLLISPTISLDVLILLFAAFAVIDGWLIVTAAVLSPPDEPGRIGALVAGVLAIVVGLATFIWPGLTQLALLVLVAVRALVVGVAELMTSVYLCRHTSGNKSIWWLIGGIGVFSIGFGVALLAFPAAALVALVRLTGLYAALVGFALVMRAWVLVLATQTV